MTGRQLKPGIVIRLAITVAVPLLLAGCASTTTRSDAPQPTPATSTAGTATALTPLTETEYFDALLARPSFANVSTDILRSVGLQTCQVEVLTHSFGDTVKANGIGGSISEADVAFQASGAIRTYCPELISEIQP